MEKLCVYAKVRNLTANTIQCESRFLQEIPPELLIEDQKEEVATPTPIKTTSTSYYGIGRYGRENGTQRPPRPKSGGLEDVHVGMKVKHGKWGIGTVVETRVEKSDTVVSVAFPGIGIKKLSLSVAPLTRFEGVPVWLGIRDMGQGPGIPFGEDLWQTFLSIICSLFPNLIGITSGNWYLAAGI